MSACGITEPEASFTVIVRLADVVRICAARDALQPVANSIKHKV
jgi:hypothetical protein